MEPLIDRLLPAPVNGGFRMKDYWIWCGSVIRADNPGEDGRYHMFASRWPRKLPFHPHWVFNCEVVRASSDTPEGPYVFEEVVLPRRGARFWDGMSTHNPTIRKIGGTYVLFYVGITYECDPPDPDRPETWIVGEKGRYHPLYLPTWMRKRTGIATSDRVTGPWLRRDKPILQTRPERWDATIISNPAPCVREDGRVYLLYKSSRIVPPGREADLHFELGAAGADHYEGPYRRLSEEPVFEFENPSQHVEDPYLWYENGAFNCIMKDMTGEITGEWGAGIHARSDDCVDWHLADPPKAWSRTIRWDDGSTSFQANFERPQLLIEKGTPTHLFAATGDGAKPWQFQNTWNMCVPLRQ